ncbi:MAG: MFS transporter [Dehalococcoidia bacterium]|nr:MFS transporter [Dehalococcoidia bacterium]MBK9342787.1 MFS transporter [Dehalococcoidia bacterium]
MSSPEPNGATLRSLGLSVYVPTFLFAVGQGAVIPIVALAARDEGASVALAGFIVALRGIGVLAFDIPAGWLVARFGEQRAMIAGTGLVIVALAGSAFAPGIWPFAVFTFLMGCGWSVWLLARLSYVTDVMPVHLRGRALSTLGGINRAGNFFGPFLGAAAAVVAGLEGAYVVHLVSAVLAAGLLLVLMRGESALPAPEHEHVQFTKVVRENAGVFMTAGVGVTAIGALRASRQGVLPLWGDHLGLDSSTISLVFGISMAMEMLLFYPAGSVMDRWGRKAVALPCLSIMAAGMFLIPLSSGFASLVVVGLLIGFGNGLGSGIVMTLGADFSPEIGRAQFLGAWRVCGDLGTAGGPLVVAAATGLASLAAASVTMGLIGAIGAGLMLVLMPETLNRERPPAPSPGPDPGEA